MIPVLSLINILYAQGYSSVERTFFKEYMDYLQMQQGFYGKVKEKYPAHFKTEHDIMALKVNQAKLIATSENFSEQSEAIKDLAYTGSKYSIVIPTKPDELAEEGINLSPVSYTHPTGCEDDVLVGRMVQVVCDMADYCRKNGISDGNCGMRSLIDWIMSTEITGDPYTSARYTLSLIHICVS